MYASPHLKYHPLFSVRYSTISSFLLLRDPPKYSVQYLGEEGVKLGAKGVRQAAAEHRHIILVTPVQGTGAYLYFWTEYGVCTMLLGTLPQNQGTCHTYLSASTECGTSQ